MSVKITGRLVTQSGSPSGLGYVIVRNESVRVSIDGEVITGESVQVPVGEDGSISFEAEPGPAVIVVGREPSNYSRYELVPLWIPENDTTLAEAFRLGQVHDLDATSPSVLELIRDVVDESISGYEERILDRVEEIIDDLPVGGDIDLDGYATEEWVNGQLEIISLTPGPQGDRGPRGKDGEDGKPGKDAEPLTVENTALDESGNTVITFSDGNTITVAKGEDGKPGKDAVPLTVENTTLDDAGNTIVAFSDGNTITVAKGNDGEDGKPGDPGKPGDNAEPLTVETTTLDDTGNTLVTFSDGNEITVAKGKDGEDGKDAEPLTVTLTTETQEGVQLSLSDGSEVLIPRGPQGNQGPPGPSGVVDPSDIRGTVVDILNLDMSTIYIDGNSAVTAQNQLRAALDYRGLDYRDIEEIPFEIKLLGVTDLSNFFNNMMKLQKAPLLNTSGVTDMSHMFSYCYAITEAPTLDVSSVTTMSNMFYRCSSLNFVPDMYPIQCTNFNSMFNGCSQLTDGNVKLFDVPSIRTNTVMIANSGLTVVPFYESE